MSKDDQTFDDIFGQDDIAMQTTSELEDDTDEQEKKTVYAKKPRAAKPTIDPDAPLPDGKDPVTESNPFDKDTGELKERKRELPADRAKKDSQVPLNESINTGDSELSINKVYPAKVTKEYAETLQRREEIEAQMIREHGRPNPNVENVQAGKTFNGMQANTLTSGINPNHFINDEGSTRSEGVEFDGILDTGAGAQKGKPVEELKDAISNSNNPAHDDFLVCINKTCAYREGCMRYRLSNKRVTKAVFFPDSCRLDGVYLSVDDYRDKSDGPSIALTPLQSLESTDTPNF